MLASLLPCLPPGSSIPAFSSWPPLRRRRQGEWGSVWGRVCVREREGEKEKEDPERKTVSSRLFFFSSSFSACTFTSVVMWHSGSLCWCLFQRVSTEHAQTVKTNTNPFQSNGEGHYHRHKHTHSHFALSSSTVYLIRVSNEKTSQYCLQHPSLDHCSLLVIWATVIEARVSNSLTFSKRSWQSRSWMQVQWWLCSGCASNHTHHPFT